MKCQVQREFFRLRHLEGLRRVRGVGEERGTKRNNFSKLYRVVRHTYSVQRQFCFSHMTLCVGSDHFKFPVMDLVRRIKRKK